MNTVITDTYKEWSIAVTEEHNLCSRFSFAVTDPAGNSRQVALGGDTKQRALQRAREMIDLEQSFAEQK